MSSLSFRLTNYPRIFSFFKIDNQKVKEVEATNISFFISQKKTLKKFWLRKSFVRFQTKDGGVSFFHRSSGGTYFYKCFLYTRKWNTMKRNAMKWMNATSRECWNSVNKNALVAIYLWTWTIRIRFFWLEFIFLLKKTFFSLFLPKNTSWGWLEPGGHS